MIINILASVHDYPKSILRIWKIENRKLQLVTSLGDYKLVTSITFSKTGLLASQSLDGTVHVWNLMADGTAGILKTILKDPKYVISHHSYFNFNYMLVFLANKPLLVSAAHGANRDELHLWDLTETENSRIAIFKNGHEVLCVSSSSKEGLFVSGGKDGKVRLWDAVQLRCIAVLDWNSAICGITWGIENGDDALLAVGDLDGGLSVWQLKIVNKNIKVEARLKWSRRPASLSLRKVIAHRVSDLDQDPLNILEDKGVIGFPSYSTSVTTALVPAKPGMCHFFFLTVPTLLLLQGCMFKVFEKSYPFMLKTLLSFIVTDHHHPPVNNILVGICSLVLLGALVYWGVIKLTSMLIADVLQPKLEKYVEKERKLKLNKIQPFCEMRAELLNVIREILAEGVVLPYNGLRKQDQKFIVKFLRHSSDLSKTGRYWNGLDYAKRIIIFRYNMVSSYNILQKETHNFLLEAIKATEVMNIAPLNDAAVKKLWDNGDNEALKKLIKYTKMYREVVPVGSFSSLSVVAPVTPLYASATSFRRPDSIAISIPQVGPAAADGGTIPRSVASNMRLGLRRRIGQQTIKYIWNEV